MLCKPLSYVLAMYNYEAWLHHNGYYRDCLEVLDECTNSLNDYNVEILLADDYRQLGNIKEAINRFEVANAMVPSRFLPLYHEMMTYEDSEIMLTRVVLPGRLLTSLSRFINPPLLKG